MSIVAAYYYRDGRRVREIDISKPTPCSHDKAEFVWIGLLEPSVGELRTLQEQFGLHPLAVEDALKAHQLPKVDIYGDQLFVTVRTAHFAGDRIEYGETSTFVGHSHVITVRHGSARAHTELRKQLEAAPTLLAHGVDYVLHAILDFVVDGYLPIVETIQEEVLAMEHRALEARMSSEDITRIFNLRGELMRFQRILRPMHELANQLASRELPSIDAEARPYFSDVLDHVLRVEALVADLRDVLTSVFEISTLLEQQRQGATTRQLAAWAAILAVPTAIAGIYGMNFENMPELKTRYGYFVVVGVICVVCTALYVRFRRMQWL